MNPPIAPRRVFEDLHGVAPSARCLSDDVIAAFADPVLSSSNEQLDSLLPSRGIVFGSIFELFGSSGCGKSSLTSQFVRKVVVSELLSDALTKQRQQKLEVVWIVTLHSLKRLVAVTVRDILIECGGGNINENQNVAEALKVICVCSANELLLALESCLTEHSERRRVVVVDSIYSILLGDDVQFGGPTSGTGGGVSYAHVVGSIRRALRSLAATTNAAVWIVNGATSSGTGRPRDDRNTSNQHQPHYGGAKSLRPYGGVLWFSTADVRVEMSLPAAAAAVEDHGVEVSDDNDLGAAVPLIPRFVLFRPLAVD